MRTAKYQLWNVLSCRQLISEEEWDFTPKLGTTLFTTAIIYSCKCRWLHLETLCELNCHASYSIYSINCTKAHGIIKYHTSGICYLNRQLDVTVAKKCMIAVTNLLQWNIHAPHGTAFGFSKILKRLSGRLSWTSVQESNKMKTSTRRLEWRAWNWVFCKRQRKEFLF